MGMGGAAGEVVTVPLKEAEFASRQGQGKAARPAVSGVAFCSEDQYGMSASMSANLALLFIMLAAFCLAIYLLADGFDLGVSMMLPLAPSADARDIMVASIEPIWDANETWLVMSCSLALAIHPPGTFLLRPAFYIPVAIMVFALVLRAIIAALRSQTMRFRRTVDLAFALSSALATFAQGFIISGFINAMAVQGGLSGGYPNFAKIVGPVCGTALIGGHVLLGAGWLIWKTDGQVRAYARKTARPALVLMAAMMVLIGAVTVKGVPALAQPWHAWPDSVMILVIVAIGVIVLHAIWRRVTTARRWEIFLLAIVIYLLGFLVLGMSLWSLLGASYPPAWNSIEDQRVLTSVSVSVVVVIAVVGFLQINAYWKGRIIGDGAKS